MSHWAEIDQDNILIRVLVGGDPPDEACNWLVKNLGGRWVQTSYNTFGGVHELGGTPFRKNYAGVGYAYDEARDAFIPPKPFDSWVLNEETCWWEPPTPMPTDKKLYTWDEATLSWLEIAE